MASGGSAGPTAARHGSEIALDADGAGAAGAGPDRVAQIMRILIRQRAYAHA